MANMDFDLTASTPMPRVGYAYVPMQVMGETYDPEKGLTQGINISRVRYSNGKIRKAILRRTAMDMMNMTQPQSERAKRLWDIQNYNFTAYDLALYLNTHPTDKKSA